MKPLGGGVGCCLIVLGAVGVAAGFPAGILVIGMGACLVLVAML